jgi:glycosyltransferase involved in cell wall biosynthesis
MNILFVHDAFPGQFKHMFEHLFRSGEHSIVAASRKGSTTKLPCKQIVYDRLSAGFKNDKTLPDGSAVYDLGLGLAQKAANLKGTKFEPEIIVSHASNGASFYLKDIFPDAHFVSFFEWYYKTPKLKPGKNINVQKLVGASQIARQKNTAIEREFLLADAAYSPTSYQKKQFPQLMQDQIAQIHDGIDTNFYCPNPEAKFCFDGKSFDHSMEIITYAARGMEDTRGFKEFMQAASLVQQQRPEAHIIIAARDRICYGNKADKGLKQWALDNLYFNKSRLHFVDLLPEAEFVKMLQVSSLHVYFTIPFVLSWSMLNAMSVGTTILASDNAPVKEAITDGDNGFLVDHKNTEATVERISTILSMPESRADIGASARQTILDNFDVRDCVQKQLKLMGL